MASRIGQGEFRNVYGSNGCNVTAGQQDYAERMNAIENQREDYYRAAGVAPGLPTMKGSYADPEVTGKGYNILIDSLGDHRVPENWVQHPVVNTEAGSNPGAPLAWGSPENPDDAVAGYGYVPCDTSEVEETFYYHSDHLGSTAYITDQKANVTQYDAYLPYGELLVDEHSSSKEMPYKFNGKELDEETGLYYYGARYMNPLTSMWYGVDPLAEKYVLSGSYVYCLGNPITMIDPDGNWERNSNGNLVAQNGDNAVTLAKYLNIAKDEAFNLLLSNGVKVQNGILDLVTGQEIKSNILQGVDVIGSLSGKSRSASNIRRNGKYHINIDKTVDYIDRNTSNRYNKHRKHTGFKSETTSIGRCSMYVSMALEKGGYDDSGHPLLAKNYKNFLLKRGWSQVSKVGYVPQKGDIIVMNGFIIGDQDHSAGHIQMFDGVTWVSDFKQNIDKRGIWPGQAYQSYKPSYVILRFNDN